MTASTTFSLPGWVDRVDVVVDRAWDPLRRSAAADRVFYTASAVGDFSVVWHGINLARLAVGAADRREATRLAVALGVESLLVNQVLKRTFRRQRPEVDRPRPRRLRMPTTTSFPSGHASSAALAAVLLAERSRAAPLYGAIAAVVATSRVHVRIHHASDVIAGAAVGATMGALVRRVAPLAGR